jgi:hypothetical protein
MLTAQLSLPTALLALVVAMFDGGGAEFNPVRRHPGRPPRFFTRPGRTIHYNFDVISTSVGTHMQRSRTGAS